MFRDYGIDVEALPAEEAAARVAASQIKLDLALSLYGWASGLRFDPRPQDPARWQRLLAISRAADPDPWLLRLQAAVEAKDVQTLRELTNGADAGRSRTRPLAYLGFALSTAGDAEAAVEFLRRVQRQHPRDFYQQPGPFLGFEANAVGRVSRSKGPHLPLVPRRPLGSTPTSAAPCTARRSWTKLSLLRKPSPRRETAWAHGNPGNALGDQKKRTRPSSAKKAID